VTVNVAGIVATPIALKTDAGTVARGVVIAAVAKAGFRPEDVAEESVAFDDEPVAFTMMKTAATTRTTPTAIHPLREEFDRRRCWGRRAPGRAAPDEERVALR
jgi:hypothetical protein